MAATAKAPFSTDAFLSVLGILAGVGAYVFEQWAAKGASVLFALALIVYVGRRHHSHPLIRVPLALVAIAVFAFLPWAKIWEDFHKSYPDVAWPEFVTWPSVHWALAIVAAVALGWEWRPVWRFRSRTIFRWRMAVEEEVWTAYSTALEIVQRSKFAVGRKPGGGFFDSMLFVTNPGLHSKFDRFCRMTLDSFASSNPRYVREGSKEIEVREDKLREFLGVAYDEDVRKQFGEVPYNTV
jgi:hypothetical protein